mgnify:CR=1 FL=1
MRYSRNILRKTANLDTHQQYGPYADFWDEWTEQAELLLEEVSSDISATSIFVSDLKEFYVEYKKTGSPTLEHEKSYVEMQKLAIEALDWQKDMLKMADERISLHREFTHKLLLVEAFDSIDED